MSTTTIAPATATASYSDLVGFLNRTGYMEDPEYKRIARLAESRSVKARRLDEILHPVAVKMNELGTADAAKAAKIINKRIVRAYRAASLTYDALAHYRETWLDARGYAVN